MMPSNKTTVVNSYIGALFITLIASGATMFILHILKSDTVGTFTAIDPADLMKNFEANHN
jgi:hypothetical protein